MEVHAKLAPLQFKLLNHFLISGDETTTLGWFMQHWQEFSPKPASSRDAVDQRIRRLNEKIKPLGLIVDRLFKAEVGS